MVQDFLHIAITCRDLERSICFYESLGLEVTRNLGEIAEEGIARAL